MIMNITNNSTFQQSDINNIPPPNPFIHPYYFTLLEEDFSSSSSSHVISSTQQQQHFSSFSSPLNQQLSQIFQPPPPPPPPQNDDILLGLFYNNKRLKSSSSYCTTDYLVNNPNYYYDSMFNSKTSSNIFPDQIQEELFFLPSTGIIPDITMGIDDIPALTAYNICDDDDQTMGGSSSSSGIKTKPNNESGGTGLSAQSVAARQRRRKITEKTQELGKLIPSGGNKIMNTAEMFHAAFKYVKYLQAQVGILHLLTQGNQDEIIKAQAKGNTNKYELQMQLLLASSTIQEKLYLKEKCLVTKDFVETLANDKEIISNQTISMDIESLVKLKSS